MRTNPVATTTHLQVDHTRPAAIARRPRAVRRAATDATAFVRDVQVLGKKVSVRERFATLKQRFLPDKAKGVSASFQFDLSGVDGGKWYVVIKNGTITVKEGSGPKADVTLRADAEDYRKVADGEMNGMWAYIRGKLKIDGDKDLLKKFPDYFREP